jgi:outer membrane protein assembly factor BamA
VTGADGFSPDESVIFDEMWRHADVFTGDPFVLAYVKLTQRSIQSQLRENSFAYATVDVAVQATPEEQAVTLSYAVDPGIRARFGEVRISGNRDVSTAAILDTLDFESGDAYSLSAVGTSLNGLFDLSTFSVVSVSPDLSDASNPIVDVDIKLSEAQFNRLRVGSGLSWDASTLSPHVLAEYRRVNLFHRLVRLKMSALLGYALEAAQGSVVSGGLPLYGFQVGLTVPRMGHRDLTLFSETAIEQKLQSGQFAYRRPELSAGLSYDASDWVIRKMKQPVGSKALFSLGLSAELFDYLDLTDEALIGAQTIFGSGFRDPYELVMLEYNMSIDSRDDPVSATEGRFLRATLLRSLPIIAGDFDFSKVELEARGYRPISLLKDSIGTPLSIAGRLRGSGLFPINDSDLPYPELMFLGGATDLRSYRLNQVGPYDCLCSYDSNDEVTQRYLPKGGRFSALASSELRYDWRYGTSFATFTDVGILVDSVEEISQDAVRYGGGIGMRYASFVGPIRLDLSFRPLMPEDAGPTSVIGCRSEADGLPRAYDLLSQSTSNRFSAFDRSVPVVTNLFLSIGEAF